MCVLIFSTTFVENVSYCKKKLARYWHECYTRKVTRLTATTIVELIY
jgi:hypothetical protein